MTTRIIVEVPTDATNSVQITRSGSDNSVIEINPGSTYDFYICDGLDVAIKEVALQPAVDTSYRPAATI